MKITILGSGSGGPFAGRFFTSHFLQMGKYSFLLDCGEATQMQCFQYGVSVTGIDAIFITHLHGDHVFGLAGLLSSMSMRGRQKKLTIFSPPGLERFIDVHTEICKIHRDFEVIFNEIPDGTTLLQLMDTDQLEVLAVPLVHRLTTYGYIFKEKEKPLNIRKEAIGEFGLSIAQIKAAKGGSDLELADGRIIKNEELTVLPSPPMSYAFCTDTMYNEGVIPHLKGIHTLYHEATFTEENTEEASNTFHSTAKQAATIAAKAGVQRLIIGHFSTRYKNESDHLKEARSIFQPTVPAVEGEVYE